ncbi:sigma-54-dependent Fis family transcriptional regulator [Treponema sp. HNW]|uniref:sigma-54-dependent Fis family transcriptional regulator n=1 Tax=Treponema sp. HNW TaxID=3116654 RepID=UPI003D0B471E
MTPNAIDVEKLNTLVEINARINGDYFDLDALLVHILESAMRLVKCEAASILIAEDSDTLKFRVALGPAGVRAQDIPVDAKGSIAGWVIEHNESLIINDVPGDPRFFGTVQEKTGYVTKTMAAVPLRFKNGCIGVIELLNKDAGIPFTQSDLDILELLSVQAGIAYQNASAYRQARFKIRKLETAISDGAGFHQFVAEDPAVLDLIKTIEQIAATNSSVLILGESGVGKELVAERIHLKSPRSSKPFVRVNCAALSEQLLESELFGHVRGAFTDAVNDSTGRFETANGGTLFLDEIGELPCNLQAKLLRVIQSRSFEKVGSSKTISVDVRIIAATNRDLEAMIKQGTFRSDLYFRLNVLPITVPPLRRRRGDIEPLANFFRKKFSTETKKNFTGFSTDALNLLYTYSWPGNIRELENSIERACVLGTPPLIKAEDFRLNCPQSSAGDLLNASLTDTDSQASLKDALFLFKKNYVTKILEQTGWNQTEAAKLLDVQRTYVSRLMNELDIR